MLFVLLYKALVLVVGLMFGVELVYENHRIYFHFLCLDHVMLTGCNWQGYLTTINV